MLNAFVSRDSSSFDSGLILTTFKVELDSLFDVLVVSNEAESLFLVKFSEVSFKSLISLSALNGFYCRSSIDC